jgi:endonuclease YncB( thermonuclease family)
VSRLLVAPAVRAALHTLYRPSGRRAWWLVAATAAAPGCGALQQPASPAPPAAGRVVRVVDGDTIVVRARGHLLTVRLLGVDTAETQGGLVECGGPAASRHLARIVSTGSRVRLVTDPDSGDTRDRYGRLLAYVDSRHGDLGERQLRAGLAYVYRYRDRRFSRLDRYRRAEDDARARRRATWSGCAGDFHSARPGRQPRPTTDPATA